MTFQAISSHYATSAEGLKATTSLNNGINMPCFGFGVYQMGDNAQTEACVRTAIELGYRHIDTAAIYHNEEGVGNALKNCGIPREEIFITTKAWNEDIRQAHIESAFDASLQKLGLEYIDLYLLHWPIEGKIVSSWQILEKLYESGRIKAIGVSNFMLEHLQTLLKKTQTIPAINQIEFHPYLQSQNLVAFCQENQIQVQAWSPLMRGNTILNDPVLKKIAAQHNKTPAQIILRWDLQSGIVTIPKSANKHRIIENADIFGFELSKAEMTSINELDRNERSGPDPYNFNF